MVDIGNAFTRKIGPLPTWGWGAVIGGGLFLATRLRGGDSEKTKEILIPTGPINVDPTQGFIEDLSNRLDDISDRIDDIQQGPTVQTPPPTNADPPAQTTPPVVTNTALTDTQVQSVLNSRKYFVSENRVPDYARTSIANLNAYIDRQMAKTTTFTDNQVQSILRLSKYFVSENRVPSYARTSYKNLVDWINRQLAKQPVGPHHQEP